MSINDKEIEQVNKQIYNQINKCTIKNKLDILIQSVNKKNSYSCTTEMVTLF